MNNRCFYIFLNMAWGLWNKIKQGFKKAGTAIKKAADFVTDKVIKPFKPFITGAATAINPTAGAIASKAMNAVEKFSDEGFTPFRRLLR